MKFNRHWALSNRYTFQMKPVQELLSRYIKEGEVWVDPFSGTSSFASITNDLNPESPAQYHMNAEDFVNIVPNNIDGILFDPPYSPRQISEVYKSVGLDVGKRETQNGRLYRTVRDILSKKLKSGGLSISFGWNSTGFGKLRGFEIVEIMLVAHGGAKNDTIVTVEKKAA